MVWRVVCRAGMILFAIACYATESMVAQAGQPPGWPVFFEAGIPTPVWAIAIERRNSGDSSYLLSGLHGGKRLPECTQSENVRAGAAGDAEGIRTELREAPYQTGDTDQPDTERGKLRRLAAKM